MDFFRHQENALRRTRFLVVVLLLEILIMIGLAIGLVFLVLLLPNLNSPGNTVVHFNWWLVAFVICWMTVIVLLAIAYKWMLIGEGGRAVAESLGGMRVAPNSRRPDERRLLNVVTEMAIASGMPVPSVYLLEREAGINAFAAGHGPADADGRRSPVASAALPGAVAAMTGVEIRKTPSTGELPATLRQSIEEPFGAPCLLYALLLDSREAVRERQLRMLDETGPPGSVRASLEFLAELSALDTALRIILVDMALPALKCLSSRQFLSLKNTLRRLIEADNGTDLFEWCLYQRVDHYLGAEFGGKAPSRPRFKNISEVREPFWAVLSSLVYHCTVGQQSRERVFSRGMTCAGLYDGPPMPEKECTMESFISGIEALACCTPLLKARILTSLVQVVKFDGVIAPMEGELVTAIAAAMDSSIPRLLDL